MTYLFPFAEVDKGSRIILYGAGAVGFEFYQQIVTSQYCELVKWVDAQYEWYQYINMPVNAPETVAGMDADKVVVAVERKEVFTAIQKALVSMGVDEDKIIWKDNYRIVEIKQLHYDEERAKRESLNAVEVNPCELLDENRMDIIIRYIYAKALLENKEVARARELYEKMIMTIHNGEEPLANGANAYFSDYTQKRGIRDFEEAFISLINSMKENGFQKEKFIPLDADGKMINGSHRLAAALALGEKVWVLKYELFKGNLSFLKFSLEWFRENGFEEEEVCFVQSNFKILIFCGE